jgi:hypothetical protein
MLLRLGLQHHSILMVGPPGAGKTMLARRLPTILPALTDAEALEVTAIHSVAGMLDPAAGAIQRRPFRAPHHSVSTPGLVGGGSRPRPGEVSLAHHGVLFLDELLEFPRSVLESLRQPIVVKVFDFDGFRGNSLTADSRLACGSPPRSGGTAARPKGTLEVESCTEHSEGYRRLTARTASPSRAETRRALYGSFALCKESLSDGCTCVTLCSGKPTHTGPCELGLLRVRVR